MNIKEEASQFQILVCLGLTTDAVINPPHGAILAVGAGLKKPIVNEDNTIAVSNVMSLTLSVDHRVIDGALGAELMQNITKYLEDPVLMMA